MKFTNIKGLLTLCFLLMFINIITAQEKTYFKFWYGRTSDACVDHKGPKKKFAIVSPVYEESFDYAPPESHVRKFQNKYWPEVLKYADTSGRSKYYKDINIGCTSYQKFDINRSKEQIIIDRKNIIEALRNSGYEVIVIDDDSESTFKPITTETYFTNLKIDDDLYIDGTVVIKSKFVFFGYPHIVAEYQNLKITGIRYKGDAFSLNSNKANKFISLPYQPKSKPHIDADFWVWTPKILNPKPLRKEHYKIFNYPIKRLVSITDNFDNDEVDAYFKGFQHQQKSDSYFWEKSILQHPKQDVMGELFPIKITKLNGAFVLDIKNKLEKYYHDKNYDFWGNKKNKNESKKEKKDDFWNN